MNKDLKSFEAHDKDYGNYFDLEKSKKVANEYLQTKVFEQLGFKKMIDDLNGKIKIHIDIGSGTGWLVMATSPYFGKVIGIEPSQKAVDIAAQILKENNLANVSFVVKDMIDGIISLDIQEPVFITTATVLSHIKDYYVKEFLEIVNKLPIGSTLFFDEPYEKNIQQNLWHIRSKEWWAKNLNNWDLNFRGVIWRLSKGHPW